VGGNDAGKEPPRGAFATTPNPLNLVPYAGVQLCSNDHHQIPHIDGIATA
jgi:hypothetical protein